MNKIKTTLKNKISFGIKYIPFLIIAVLVGVTVTYAASKLAPSGDSKTDQMYSLTDIYNLTQGQEAEERTGEIAPTPDTIESTEIPTLTEVYNEVKDALAAIPVVSSGGLPATGQTSCWDTAGSSVSCTGTGQDGDTLKGTALSYTDNGNGTVTDDVTDLMWLKDPTAIGALFNAGMTWQNALTSCNTLSYGGYDDWRLPNIKELQSLVNFEKVNPAIDTDAFPNTQSGGYWSSTSYQSDGEHGSAWLVNFFNGFMYNDGKTNIDYYVRCVR